MPEQKPDGDKKPFFDKKHRVRVLKADGEKKKFSGGGYLVATTSAECNDINKELPVKISMAVTYNVEAPVMLNAILEFFHTQDANATKMIIANFIHATSQQEKKAVPKIFVPGRN